jgi:superfamily I DNA/RNA helicase
LRADLDLRLNDGQRRVVEAERAGTVVVSGPPRSGKTTALAARAARLGIEGPVLVICSHEGSAAAFRSALSAVGGDASNVDTLERHIARWMRGQFVAAGASPDLAVGTDADSLRQVYAAAKDVLDLSWPGFRDERFTLDLPLLSRTDAFFEEAAGLFRQLRRAGVTPQEFEVGCRAGLVEFYGSGVERALASCADPEVNARASRRGRDALSSGAAAIEVQKKAERDLASLLAHLYVDYRNAARGADILSPEDVIDEGLDWLRRDPAACEIVARPLSGVIVDDGEDAQPGTQELLEMLATAGLRCVTISECKGAAIDGIGGRRGVAAADRAARIDLAGTPLPAPVRHVSRWADEEEEAAAVAAQLGDLLRGGAPPDDIVVLARDTDAAAVYARLLSGHDVPIAAPVTRWQSPHDVADLLALAAIVDDPYDNAHLLRVLASPLVGLSDASLWTLCRDQSGHAQLTLDVTGADDRKDRRRSSQPTTLADNVFNGSADHLLSDQARSSVRAFRTWSAEMRAICSGRSAAAALGTLIEAAGVRAAWHAQAPYLRARLADDAARLVAAAAAFAAGGRRTVAQTVRAIEDGEANVRAARDAPGAIACGTIVEWKGRRARYAFVVGVAHERFPRIYVPRAFAFSRRFGLIARENTAGGASQTAKYAWYYAKFEAKERFLEEERRALDYGLARADAEAWVSGFGRPPRWALDQDLLARLERRP